MKCIFNFLIALCLILICNTSLLAQNKNEGTGSALTVANDSGKVDFGFIQKKKRDAVSAVSSVNPGERLTFDDAESAISQMELLLGLSSGNNIRGIGAALYVIDGIPGRDINLLNASEIENITVLKDVNAAALYGSQARNGVIIVTTKRGKVNKNEIRVKANYGIKSPVSYPKYLGSAEYMELYNEARTNDGLTPLYIPETIDNTKSGLNPYKYPDMDFYGDNFLKPLTTQSAVMTQFLGGNDKLQYYVNLDYENSGTLEKINPDLNKGFNSYKVRGNLDFPINTWIKSTVDIMATIGSQKMANASILTAATTFRPNLYAPFLPVSMLSNSPAMQSQLNSINVFDGYILGGSASYKGTIPFAQINAEGYKKLIDRTTQVANTLGFDLSKITAGLSAKTYISLDYYDRYNLSITNKFNFYEPAWSNDTIIKLTPLGATDLKDQTESVSTTGFNLRTGIYGQINYAKVIHSNHTINAALVGYSNSSKISGIKQTNVSSHLALSLDYNYKNKYYANFTSAYSHSTKLAEGNRGKLSPTFGISYVISEEKFLKELKMIDYLKFRATWGSLKTDVDIPNYFMYQDIYEVELAGSFTWADGTRSTKRTSLLNGRNLGLTYIEREDRSAGFEASLFKSLAMEMNYFRTDIGGFVSQITTKYPSFYTPFIPYENSEKNRYEGLEIGLNYKKDFGPLNMNVGGTFLYSTATVLEADQLSQEYDYMSALGQPLGRIIGLIADGFYNTSDFNPDGTLIATLPVPQFGKVKPGDLKYVDLNNDKMIDTKDNKTIGNNAFPYSFGVNVLLRYRGFSLFAIGKGQTGAETTKSSDYYWVNGDDKYPEIVRGRWTEANAANATFPRLTTGAGSNNFRTSTFWLYDKSYFNIRRVQLTYEFNEKVCKSLRMNNVSVNLAGANLWSFAPNKEIYELNFGGNPQFRSFTLGLRISL